MTIIFGHPEPADTWAYTLHAQVNIIEGLLNLAAEGQDFENSFRIALRMVRDIDRDILRDTLDDVPGSVLSALSLIKVRSVDNLPEYPPARFAVGIDAVVAAVERWAEPWSSSAKREGADALTQFHTEFEAFAAQRQKQAHERCAYKPGAYKRREAVRASLRLVPQQDIFG